LVNICMKRSKKRFIWW